MSHRHDSNRHITDRELLLEADGEFSTAEAAAIREHLAGCWTCRTRKAELAQTIEDFVHVYEKLSVPPVDAARASLKARLGEETEPQWSWWRRPQVAWWAAALVLLAGGTAWFSFAANSFSNNSFSVNGERFAPDSALTPGAVRIVKREVVCSTQQVQSISESQAQAVFRRYGIRDPHPRSYEVDYLIPPSLGGSDDLKNLWPEPYSHGVWNARVKDALEDRLHSLVCDGKLDLATAQRELAQDWIAAYKKHFQSNQPRLDHIAFVKDRPWQ